MSIWVDVLPLVAFFVLYRQYDIFVATIALAVLSVLGTVIKYRQNGRIDTLPLVTVILVVVFGGLTVYFHNDFFLKAKVSLAYLVMASVFAWSTRAGQEPLLEKLLAESMRLPRSDWVSATRTYALFFLALSLLNVGVAYAFDLDTWVKFKVFGTLTCTLLFMGLHTWYLSRRQLPEEAVAEGSDLA